MKKFEIDKIYYGSLICAHSQIKYKCVKRSKCFVWLYDYSEDKVYKLKIYTHSGHETASQRSCYISSDGLDTSWNMQFA